MPLLQQERELGRGHWSPEWPDTGRCDRERGRGREQLAPDREPLRHAPPAKRGHGVRLLAGSGGRQQLAAGEAGRRRWALAACGRGGGPTAAEAAGDERTRAEPPMGLRPTGDAERRGEARFIFF
jgi:hypothetical protein